MRVILGVIICPWCYMPFIGGDSNEILCPHCNRKINQWDLDKEELCIHQR